MIQLAIRMARHRLTSLVAIACAALGGAALVTATGVLTESGLRSHAPVGRLAGAEIVVTAPQSVSAPESIPAVLPERNRIPGDLVAGLAEVPGVRHVVGDVSFPAALLTADGPVAASDDPRTAGHGWSSVRLLGRHSTDGSAPVGTDEVALGSAAAAAADVSVGDDVEISTAGGAARTHRVAAIVDGGADELFFSDAAAAAIREAGGSGTTADLIGLDVAPGSVDTVADAVREQLRGSGLEVSTGADRGDTAAPDVTAARGTLLLVAGSLGGIVVMLVGFVVTGAVTVSVAGQRRALALMRSIGATPRQVRTLVAGETSATAAIAAIPGIVLGYLLAGQLGDLLRATDILPPSLPLTYGPLPAVAGVVSMVVVAQLAARAAAWRPSRMPTVDAMVESSSEARVPSRLRERIGLLVLLGAVGLSAAPVLLVSDIGAAMTSTAGIVAAIGLAVAAPALLRRASDAVGGRIPDRVSAPTWLAVTNMRVFTTRFAGVITASAMLMTFTLTYAISQTTLVRASADSVRDATTAELRVTGDGLGGVPADLAEQVRELDGVRAAAPMSTTSVVWPHEVLGDTEVEAEPAMVLDPEAPGVLDLDVQRGSLADLEGDTIAVGAGAADARDAQVGRTVSLTLGDGTEVRPRVVAVYDRQLGLGSVVLSRDLALQHTTSGLDHSLLVRTDDTSEARASLATLAATRPGLEVETTTVDSHESIAAQGMLLNVATIAVLLGYLALTISNRIVAVTTQRRGEIAALRTAGATRAQVLGTTRRESLIAAGVAVGAALAVSALPLVFLGIGFLGRPWPSAPIWLVPATAALVVGLIVVSVELPTRYLLRSSPTATGR
ncbi:FtsX-like permease family protein [Aeromicrobium sp. SMF47]|uniref:ABC transporter permease n=1 Tax=Aeromicrobium yanjiei TaxID=2662028 RepID=UPI0013F7EEEF|nr:ABC transporter permease [Aeromicrobium yanjiei]MRJ78313.1 FtsX-like permease family protein [Aeromicrobium yanjiei]